ncbi:MAG: GtrA family protein [Burkholderiales bacterium]
MDSEVNPAPTLARQFMRYAGVGAIGTAGHFAVYITLVNLRLGVTASSAVGFVVGALINYWLNYHYTFNSDQPHRLAMAKFFTVALVGLALNTLIVFILDHLQWHFLLAQAAATIVVLMWNFAANRRWTFGGD